MPTKGEFTLILGPMASGKSFALIAELDRYRHAKQNVVIVHSALNVREDDIESRIGVSRKALKVRHLGELKDKVNLDEVDVIGVDETFMFDDAEDTFKAVKGWLEQGKIVVASSLDVVAKGVMPETVKRLLELAPDVRYERAVCEDCGVIDARFTRIYDKSGIPIDRDKLPEVIPDDGSVIYKPVCRECFYGFNK